MCFRSYARDAAEVAAERIAAMVRPYVEKGNRAALAGGGGERRIPVRSRAGLAVGRKPGVAAGAL